MNSPHTQRILIVDDEKIVRDALSCALKTMPGFEVVGQAEDGLEAIHQHKQLLPDIVLMDAQMPHVNGITATRQIRKSKAHSQVIALMTFGDDPLWRNAMLEAGAVLCLSKQDSLETLEAALSSCSGDGARKGRFLTSSL